MTRASSVLAQSILILLAAAASAPVLAKGDAAPRGATGDKGGKAAAEDSDEGAALRQTSVFGGASKAPWRGSQIVMRNELSAVSLDPSADLTYNPYFAMSWSFRPWWWFTDKLYVRAQLDVTRELTQADDTTYADEALLQDIRLIGGGSGLYTIPYAKVLVSADLALTLPTSKASQARTLVLGIGPGVRLSRSFDVLGGLVVGYGLRVTPYLHRYATSERETPLIPGCGVQPGGCDPYLNTGLRNPAARLTQSADVSLRILDWLGAGLAVGHAVDWLRSIGGEPAAVSLQPQDAQDQRYLTFMELEVSFQPLDELEIGVGYSALHPQLAPDSSYYVPFFNRYSTLYVDLKLHVENLVSRIQRMVR